MSIAVKDKLVTVEGLDVILGKDRNGDDVGTTYLKNAVINAALAKIGLVIYNNQFYIQPYEGED